MLNVTSMKRWALAVGMAALLAGAAQAQPAPGMKSLAVGDVKVAAMLNAQVIGAGRGVSLGRVREAMDGQLIDRFNQTRKFKIIARSDLDALLKEQGFVASGNVDTDDPKAAKQFKIKGPEFIVVTTIDDFQDFVEEATFEGTGQKASKRLIRLSAIGKLYNTTSGELLDSTNFQISQKEIGERRTFSTTNGELSDALLLKVSREMADKVANRVIDVIFPAKVIAVSGRQVTINRGDGTGIASGQLWGVYSLGKEMKDPDTGEILGREEILIGKVKVGSVQPKTAKAEVVEISETESISEGNLLRMLGEVK